MQTKSTDVLWRAALSNKVADLLRGLAPVSGRALLFGSRARGDAGEDSDWDVLFLIDKDDMTSREKSELSYQLWMLGLDYGQDVNAITYTTKEWNKRSFLPFYKNVMHDGIEL